MRNRVCDLLLVGTMVLSMAGCGGNASKQTSAEEVRTAEVNETDMRMKTIQLGDVRATWIQDNAEDRLSPPSLFPDADEALINSLSLQDGIPSSMSVFLVEANGARILFDTGLGSKDSRLLPALRSLGIEPGDIQYVYLTHFHGDHIGGMMNGNEAVFPQAEVYAAQVEYDAWMAMPAERKAQVEKTMAAYKDHLHLFAYGDTLPGGVMTMAAIGHTPGHTAFQVGQLLVIGDLIHGSALQLEHPEICATYDMDKESSVSARKHFLQYAKDNQLTMAGMHLPAPGFH